MSGEKQNLEVIETETGKQLVAKESGASAILISEAIAKGANLEQFEKLLELQIRFEKNEAKKAYFDAMAAFKADPPILKKSKEVSFENRDSTVTSYKHAVLAESAEIINKALSKHGLSASWTTDQKESRITVTCKITHRLGHSESTTLSAPPDDSGKKNKIQQIGSTITYLERYTLFALTGLAAHGDDDDGKGAGVEYITEEQANDLYSRIEDNNLNSDGKYLASFLKWLGVDIIEEIPAKQFDKACQGVEFAIAKKKEERYA